MYKNLENRIFNSYLLQSAPKLSICKESSLSESAWQSLYNWTKNTYLIFSEQPELIVKSIHEDDAYPNRYNCASYGKPKLKQDMRKNFKTMNSFLQLVWDCVINGDIKNDILFFSKDFKISPKNAQLLEHTGISLNIDSLQTNSYPGMFSAIHELSVYSDGFKRFVRCSYNENSKFIIAAYRQFAGDSLAFNRLIDWLRKNNYTYAVTLDDSQVQNFESSKISFMKNICGNKVTNFSDYDHEHIGFAGYFNALIKQPSVFKLFIQKVREILADFKNLDSTVQTFIINNHAKCNSCGYCTQRSKGKQKPYAIITCYENKKYAFCPINYVYTYHWDKINDELTSQIIAFLDYYEKKFM